MSSRSRAHRPRALAALWDQDLRFLHEVGVHDFRMATEHQHVIAMRGDAGAPTSSSHTSVIHISFPKKPILKCQGKRSVSSIARHY
jgi:hypothetical protein